MTKPRIGLLLGDPCGIGPEVAAKPLARPDTAARAEVLVLGDRAVFAAGRRTAGIELEVPEMAPGAPPRNAAGLALHHVDFEGREHRPPGAACAQAGAHVLDLLRRGADLAAARGIDALGPLPADTVFVRARREGLHGVVSMFHDQCQIAMKLLGFDRGVTVLAGLPFPVATAAHGTAFDIVGQGRANPEPMVRAFDTALRLAGAAPAGAN